MKSKHITEIADAVTLKFNAVRFTENKVIAPSRDKTGRSYLFDRQ